jgi:hypothetical protein
MHKRIGITVPRSRRTRKTARKQSMKTTNNYLSYQSLPEPSSLPISIGYPVELKFTQNLAANAAGVILGRISPFNPTRAFNGTGTYNDVASLSNVFDQYKVGFVLIEYFPTSSIAISSGCLALALDYDDPDTTNLTSLNDVISYQDKQIRQLSLPWRYWTGFLPSPTAAKDVNGDPCPIYKGGYFDFANAPVLGAIQIASSALPPNLVVGTIVITMRFKMRRQR